MLANQKLREFYNTLTEVKSADYTLPTAPFNLVASLTEASSILRTYRCRFVKFKDVKTETFAEPARNILIVPSEEMAAAVHGNSDGWSDDTDYDDEVCILITTDYDPSLPNNACQYLIHYLGKLGNGLGFYSTYSYNYSSGGAPININAMGYLTDFGVYCKLVALMAKFQELFPVDEVYTFGDESFQFMFTPDYHYGSRVPNLKTFINDKGDFEPVTTGEQYLNTTGVDLTTTRSYTDGYYWLFPNLFQSNVVYCTKDSPETFTKEEVFANTYVNSSYGMWGTAQMALDNLSGFISDLITYIPEDITDDTDNFKIDVPAFKEAYEALIARGMYTADNMGSSNYKSLRYEYTYLGDEYYTTVLFYKSYNAAIASLLFNKSEDVIVVNDMTEDYNGPCLIVKACLDPDVTYGLNPYVSSYLSEIFQYWDGNRNLYSRNEYNITGVQKSFTVGTDVAKFCMVNSEDGDTGEAAPVENLFFLLEQQMVFYNTIGQGFFYHKVGDTPVEYLVKTCHFGPASFVDYSDIMSENEIAEEFFDTQQNLNNFYNSISEAFLPIYIAAHPELPENPEDWSTPERNAFMDAMSEYAYSQLTTQPVMWTEPNGCYFAFTYIAPNNETDLIDANIYKAGNTPFGNLYTEEGYSTELELSQHALAELYLAYVLITNPEMVLLTTEPEDSMLVLHTVNGVRPFKFGSVVKPEQPASVLQTQKGVNPYKFTH